MTSYRPITELIDPAGQRRPREDHGFFGPGSPTWRVWTYPTSPLMGFQRAVTIETFDPHLTAAVEDQGGVYADVRARYDSTVWYFATVAVGDSRAAVEASEILMRIHAKATGIDPISGRRYSANNPDSQLWIHMTAWHSILYAYERYGPGKLSPEDEARYWAECAVAAEMQPIDPAKVPRSRAEVRDYFADWRPRLCASENSRRQARHFLYPPFQKEWAPIWPAVRLSGRAAAALIPRWMRQLGGFDQPPSVDAAVTQSARAFVRALKPLPSFMAAADVIAPSVRPVVEPVLRGVPPLRDEIVTPARARELYGRKARAAGSGITVAGG